MKRSGVERRCNQVLIRVEITRFLRTLVRRFLQCLGIAQGWKASSATFRQYGSKDTLLLSINSWSNHRKTRRRQLRAVRLNQTKHAGRSLRNFLLSCARRLPKQDAHCVHLVVVVYWVGVELSKKSLWCLKNTNEQGRYVLSHLLCGQQQGMPLRSLAAFQLLNWKLS